MINFHPKTSAVTEMVPDFIWAPDNYFHVEPKFVEA